MKLAGGNHVRKLMLAVSAGLLREGQLHEVDVAHDGWCRHLKGGKCNCDPDLFLNGRKLVVQEARA